MRELNTSEDVAAAAGEELGVSDWLQITQDRIDAFADATGDHQWIHVDPERAASGPFGGPIAHGYLTLSLVPFLGSQVFSFGGAGARINYGTNKVRFPAPVPVGSRVRARVTLAEVEDIEAGQQCVVTYTIELEGSQKPACIAETVVLRLSQT